MRFRRSAGIRQLTLISLCAAHAAAAEPAAAGGVLSQFSIAAFGGSGQNSIQAVATDSHGNIYVAGTTSSADLPVRNAAQPGFGDARILRTTDLGITWKPVGSPPEDVGAVIVDPVDPQVLFAGGGTGIYKSADGGQSWRTVYQFQPSGYPFTTAPVIDPANHLRLAALTPSGRLVRSLDDGETWTAGGLSCPISSCGGEGRLLADPNGSGTLAVLQSDLSISRDWGVTFQRLGPPGPGLRTAAAFAPSHAGWIYAASAGGTSGSLALSMDYGATWVAKATPPTTFSAIWNLAVDPDQPDVLVAATPDGLYKSSDGAASWTRQAAAVSSFSVQAQFPFAILSSRCAPAGGLFALGGGAGGYQVDFSPDYGATWMTPQLTSLTSVASGPGCAVYVTRRATTDAFVAKLAPDGTGLWTTFLGGSDQDAAVAMVLDAQDNAYVIGNTSSPDFPSTVPRIGVPGQNSVFVAKFSAEGALAYSAVVSGESRNTASAIAVDSSGNAYLAGRTNSVNFPVTPGALVATLDPGSYTGFLLKLSTAAEVVYATYLGSSYTFPLAMLVDHDGQPIISGTGSVSGVPPPEGMTPTFVMRLDRAASQVVSAAYLQGAGASFSGTGGLAADAQGDLLVAVSAASGVPATPGAYSSPAPLSACSQFSYSSSGVFLIKLAAADWRPVYRALLRAPCGIQPGPIVVDGEGAVVLALASGGGLPLHVPLLAGPTCSPNSSLLAGISQDGSALTFATYLDNCSIPAITLAPDGSLYAGVSPSRSGEPAGVLHLNSASEKTVSLDQIANAFSGNAGAVAGGGLYSLTGSGFQLPAIDLGLNAAQDLPTEPGGVQVTFDGIPAPILQTTPDRVIVAAPAELATDPVRAFTAVQLVVNSVPSNSVWMPVSKSLPGLLTHDFPDLLARDGFADGNIRNADGTLNDPDHPAAAGPNISLFATGMGATNPMVAPGSIANSTNVVPVTAVYSSWKRFSLPPAPDAEAAYSLPGFVSALFEIDVHVPDSLDGLGGTEMGNGVRRVPVALLFSVPLPSTVPPASNVVAVYLK